MSPLAARKRCTVDGSLWLMLAAFAVSLAAGVAGGMAFAGAAW